MRTRSFRSPVSMARTAVFVSSPMRISLFLVDGLRSGNRALAGYIDFNKAMRACQACEVLTFPVLDSAPAQKGDCSPLELVISRTSDRFPRPIWNNEEKP